MTMETGRPGFPLSTFYAIPMGEYKVKDGGTIITAVALYSPCLQERTRLETAGMVGKQDQA